MQSLLWGFLFLQNTALLFKETSLSGAVALSFGRYLSIGAFKFQCLSGQKIKMCPISLSLNHFPLFMKKYPLEYLVVFFIRAYQLFLSPLLAPSCRFMPSCSNYALLSIKKHGVVRGLFYSFRRVFKCHPFYNNAGYDPVP